MQKWEYDLRPLSADDLNSLESGLNNYGDLGWELVQIITDESIVFRHGGDPLAIFKRLKS